MTDAVSPGPADRDHSTARLLDPTTAGLGSRGERPSPTLYLGDRLLLSGFPQTARGLQLDEIGSALADLGLTYRPTERSEARLSAARSSRGLVKGLAPEILDSIWVSSVVIDSVREPANPPDAWTVLQQLRQHAPEVATRVSLEHVIRPAGYWGGVAGYWGGVAGYWGGVAGYWGGVAGYWGGVAALQEYEMPGRGGRSPVRLIIEDPARHARQDLGRPPVVAVLDTVIHTHPWFVDGATFTQLQVSSGQLVPSTAPPLPPNNPLTGERKQFEGHGTFIAGLIRQGCPEATILSIPIMDDDGVAEESDVLEALTLLLSRHIAGQHNGVPRDVIDVLSLSVGYYAEDSSYLSSPTKLILDRFTEHGVIVVAGAGNDATDRPFVPAALAAPVPKAIRATSRPPVSSVGALNPDGATVALFSNASVHLSALRPGVALVSTVPAVNGGGQSSVGVDGPDGRPRRTMDPDDYTSGFATWSGTSFATPVLAAEVAAELVGAADLDDTDDLVMRRRAIKTLRTCFGRNPR